MTKESARKIMADIMANSPEFAAQMEAARKVETGDWEKPVIVKLTGRMDNPQITNESIAEKPIDVINRLSGRDKPPVETRYTNALSLTNEQFSYLMDWENKFEKFLWDFFSDLNSSDMDSDEKDEVVKQFIARTDIDEEWIGYKDNVDDEVPGQDERDYPQSFLE